MADTTTRYSFPYQEVDDPPNGPALGQDLAEAVEGALGPVDDRVGAVEDRTTERPLCRLIQTAAQSIPDNADTALTFTTEEIDTHGFHDNSTSTRITPTVAGYYRLTGTYYAGARTDQSTISATVRKNGTTAIAPRFRMNPNASNIGRSVTTTVLVTANGTTDYFELMALQDNVANVAVDSQVGGSVCSVFEAEYLRPL